MVEQLIAHLIMGVVSKPDVVTVSIKISDGKKTGVIHVAPQDLSRIVGNDGRALKSIKTIIHNLMPDSCDDLAVDVLS